MKPKQMPDADVMQSTATNVFQGPGFKSSTVPTDAEETEKPSILEQALHDAGYLVMPNQPPPKFWSWANIGNIFMILTAMAALGYWLWNTAIDVGIQKERNRQNEERQARMAADIDQLQKMVIPATDETPVPTKESKKK